MSSAPFVSPRLDRPIRLAVLISGGGTTLENLLQHIGDGRLNAEVAVVIADKPGCGGIEKAQAAGLTVHVVPRAEHDTVPSFSRVVFAHCDETAVDLVILGGFLSLVEIPAAYESRVMNIHPALIPAFCGKGYYGQRVHAAVLERGARVSGCTVHFADNQYDHGPIIVQRCVPVENDDTPKTLAARVFEAECEAYPEAIRLFASGRIEVTGTRLRIRATS